jgi:hypothetical protein
MKVSGFFVVIRFKIQNSRFKIQNPQPDFLLFVYCMTRHDENEIETEIEIETENQPVIRFPSRHFGERAPIRINS